MSKFIRSMTAVTALGALAACSDAPLEVKNVNNPDTERALKSPADVEKLIADAYNTQFIYTYGEPTGNDPGIYSEMSAMAFEHSPMAANFGMIERSALPRLAINNNASDTYASTYFNLWKGNNSAAVSAALGFQKFNTAGFTVGDAGSDERAKAFAYFVAGLAHGTLAMAYDSASVIDPATFDPLQTPALVGYDSVNKAALAFLDKTISIASAAPAFTLPETWINGNALNNAGLIRLARTYKAKFRAQVARSKAERDAADWTKILDDANNGITSTFNVTMDDNVWFHTWSYYQSFFGAWNQMNYFIEGMADSTGKYQAWMADANVMSRQPFVLATADRRFPYGTTATEQQAKRVVGQKPGCTPDPTKPGICNDSVSNRGLYIWYKGAGGGHVRAERGQWRWSFYQDSRFNAFYATYQGAYPIITKAEVDLLKAEAYIRKGDAASAIPLINATRARIIKVGASQQDVQILPAVTDAGPVPGGNACVPKLPNGNCGDLWEAMKWEKRMETWNTGFGSWYLDSRGWGDLPKGTPLSWPVPARELQVRQHPLYTTGGAFSQSMPTNGTYGY